MDIEESSDLGVIPTEVKENYDKSKDLLKGYFKALYENAGMEWTKENDNEIDFVVKSITLMAVCGSGDLLVKVFDKK